MRPIILPLVTATLLAASSVHATGAQAQNQAAGAVAKSSTPTPAQAQEAIRTWAEALSARDPAALKDAQVQEARTTMKVKAVENCQAERSTASVICDITVTVPDKKNAQTQLKFELDGGQWKFVGRK